ncbi:MAG TPA: acyl-CoA thioesterase [Flavitalea sp.]|nr:acyl-CoA thioesterase [Flavitalea sp.]
MEKFILPVEIRWSDLDPNFHLRHSVYYDFGAYARIQFLTQAGLTPFYLQEHKFGPIIFREECVFRKELQFGDAVTIDLAAITARKDYSRWSIRHHIYKNADTLAAVLTIDGSWIDTSLRKLTIPTAHAQSVFASMPRDSAFVWQ